MTTTVSSDGEDDDAEGPLMLALVFAVLVGVFLWSLRQALRNPAPQQPKPSPELERLLGMQPRTRAQRMAYLKQLLETAQRNGAKDLRDD